MRVLLLIALVLVPTSLSAKDSLGTFGDWGAFRDVDTPRCYAIAMAAPSSLQRDYQPYASVGTWPGRNVRGQVHFRLSRNIQSGSTIRLRVGDRNFSLTGGGGDAWAQDQRMDAAIVAAMRSASRMSISARGSNGRNFSNSYKLNGVATAMDAATVGCAKLR